MRCLHYVWKKLLTGLILGNIPSALERNNEDINWVPALAVQTRTHAKQEGVTSKLNTPDIIDQIITPVQVSNAQKYVVSLRTTRSRCESNECYEMDKTYIFMFEILKPGGQLWANTAFEGSQFHSIGVLKLYS